MRPNTATALLASRFLYKTKQEFNFFLVNYPFTTQIRLFQQNTKSETAASQDLLAALYFLASFFKTTETFDCNSSSTWLGNNLRVQFKSSTYFNSFMTHLNFFACCFRYFSLISAYSLFSKSIHTLCQGGRKCPAVSPWLGTANRANSSNVAGLLGSL